MIVLLGAPFTGAIAKSVKPAVETPRQWASAPAEIDAAATYLGISTSVADTTWIVNWTFEGGNPCDVAGWTADELPVLPELPLFWSVDSRFSGTGGISGNAAVLGTHDLCWPYPDGYGNDWYQAITIRYAGKTLLSADYLLDSESGFDLFQVEADSQCVFLATSNWPQVLFSDSGFEDAGSVAALLLPDFGAPADTHCVHLSFFSDGGYSQEDGLLPTNIGAALVVDDVVLSDAGDPSSPALITFGEDFEGPLGPHLGFASLQPAVPSFGLWARLFQFPAGSIPCARHRCAWVFTDPELICPQPGPTGCVPQWIDNAIISPWVSLAATPGAAGTVLELREFPGQPTPPYIMNQVAVRSRVRVDNTDTPAPGDSVLCAGHFTGFWRLLSGFDWRTRLVDLSGVVDPAAVDVQVRYRVSTWDLPPPGPNGPGPYIDRVRLGRRALTGPVISEGIDSRSQAQDAFPTEVDPTFPPGTGEHHRPTTDIFGTCAFSQGGDLGFNLLSPRLVTGDSIAVEVTDARGAGGVTAVELFGCIVAGPHAGKSPPPWPVEANGFFRVPADSARTSNGQVIQDHWYVDLDDDYFRGGDQLLYFWLATDAAGGMASDPPGLDHVPASLDEAVRATNGLLEVSYLPTILWSPNYRARIVADPHGKLAPTPDELAASPQKNCILYAQTVNPRRRGGDLHRTSFLYTLERLGYRFRVDVYDAQGHGNTNNQLAGRATIEQAAGYPLLVYDTGNHAPGAPILPDGSDLDAQKIDQAGWFRSWLAQAASTPDGWATLWLLGANLAEEKSSHPLLATDMGVVLAGTNQSMGVSPDVEGQTTFTFDQGVGSATVDFRGSSKRMSLAGGCLALPTGINLARIRNYDALEANGTAVVTHRYRTATTVGEGAMVMNRNAAGNWNTILSSFPWLDIRDPFGTPAAVPPEAWLLSYLLGATLPVSCLFAPGPTDSPQDLPQLPLRTALHPNVPNPFNPVTTIAFDLAARGHVELRVYDVAGHLVRTLVEEVRDAARHRVAWDGRDTTGRPVASGIYIARLRAVDYEGHRKLVVLR